MQYRVQGPATLAPCCSTVVMRREGASLVTDVISLVVLIGVLYLAFRIGAVLMKVLLGLLALGLLAWLVMGLFGGAPSV